MPYLSRKEIIGLINGNNDIIKTVTEKYLSDDTYCALCGKKFTKENGNSIYCPKCKDLSYDVRVKGEKKKQRVEYKKMYARKMRGKITEEEFQEWKSKDN